MKKLMVVSLLALLMLLATPSTRSQAMPQGADTREVKITAKKYEFSPNTVEVNAGTRIIFKITALDREHGFKIAEVKTAVKKLRRVGRPRWKTWAEKAGAVGFGCYYLLSEVYGAFGREDS